MYFTKKCAIENGIINHNMKDLKIEFDIDGESKNFGCYEGETTNYPANCFKDAEKMWAIIYKQRGLLPQVGDYIFCDHENLGRVIGAQWLRTDYVIFWVK